MELEIRTKLRVKSVRVKVVADGGRVLRRCVMTLDGELDGIAAAALGKDANAARDAILAGGMTKAELPLDAIESDCTMDNEQGKKCYIPKMRGLKATVTRGRDTEAESDDDEDSPPAEGEPTATIAMQWEFPFSDDTWLFLGRAAGAWADVKISPLQQVLPGLGKTARLSLVDEDEDEKKEGGLAF